MQSYPNTTPAAPPPLAPVRVRRPRYLQFAAFLAAISWYLCALAIADSATRGLALRFELGDTQPLVEVLCLLFLLVLGLVILRAIERRRAPLRLTLGLPRRASARAEWATGAAIGWGIALAAILPMALARTLNVRLWTTPRAFELLGLTLATLAVVTLAHTLAIFGYAFQRLIDAIGPTGATLLIALLAALKIAFNPAIPRGAVTTCMATSALAAILLCLCWLRTHGLWIAWGLHFAWAATTGILFGLPIAGDSYSSVLDTRAAGPIWLTGGGFGPSAAVLSLLVLIAGIVVLVRSTSDWAWAYTHPPLIPAGYDVTIAPPAAHVAMEQAAAQPINPATLVQILPTTPRTPTHPTPPANTPNPPPLTPIPPR